MSQTAPAVIVKKNGVFASIAQGFFGLLITAVICASGVAVYGLHVIDGKFEAIVDVGEAMAGKIEQWREVMPPAIAEAFDDQRGDGYDENIDIRARLVDSGRHGSRVAFEVSNRGAASISWMALNVVVKDRDGVPVDDFRIYAATPLPIDDCDWRGPLRQGTTREFARWIHYSSGIEDVAVEITELRLQRGTWQNDTEVAHAP